VAGGRIPIQGVLVLVTFIEKRETGMVFLRFTRNSWRGVKQTFV